MGTSAVAFLILTFVLFQFSNAGSSGGSALQTPLADQATTIGVLMALTFVIPIVLGILYLVYGECGLCTETKDQAVPTEEGGKPAGSANPICIAAACLPVVIIIVAMGGFIYINSGGGNSDVVNGIAEDIMDPIHMPFNGSVNGTLFT